MSEILPVSKRVRCLNPDGFHNLNYYTWSKPKKKCETLMCVHGLTRNGRDFDYFARGVIDDYQVVCPDVVGRGESDWLINAQAYNYDQYTKDIVTLIGRIGVDTLKWVGTSMGGVIGMMLASLPNSPIKKLVLNDIGPYIAAKQSERVQSYVGVLPQFPNLKQARSYIERIYSTFGNLTDDQWQHLTEHSFYKNPEGMYKRKYDPGIALGLKDRTVSDINLWPNWANIRCPVMLIWGENSDYVSSEMVDKMRKIKPDTEVVFMPGVGHAPALMDAPTINKIKDFLDK